MVEDAKMLEGALVGVIDEDESADTEAGNDVEAINVVVLSLLPPPGR